MQHSGSTYSESEMPCYEENWIFEVESIVEIIVIDDNRRAERNPDRDDRGGRKFGLWFGR